MDYPHLSITGSGQPQDCNLVLPLLQRAWDVVAVEFVDRGVDQILQKAPWTLVWHGADDLDSMIGCMWINTSREGNELHLLAPSAHRSTEPDGFPAAYSRDWYQKNLIHECTSAFMFQYAPDHPLWALGHGSPDWFQEGLQEFVAVERSPITVRDSYRTRYCKRQVRQTVGPNFQAVSDRYIDGYLLLRCFYEIFGRSAVHSILDRAHPNFWATLEAAFDSDLPRVYSRWLHWSGHNTVA